MVMKIQVEVLWVVLLCSVVVGYHCFRGPCFPHFYFKLLYSCGA